MAKGGKARKIMAMGARFFVRDRPPVRRVVMGSDRSAPARLSLAKSSVPWPAPGTARSRAPLARARPPPRPPDIDLRSSTPHLQPITNVMSKAAFWAALSAALILGTATPAWAVTYSVTGSQTFQTIEPGHANALCFTVTITSSHIMPVTLQSIRFKNLSVGSGATQAQLDQELGSPRLYRDTGSGAFEAGSDSLMKQSSASGGYLLFSAPANASIPALGSITLFVVTNIPTAVRDGENLDLSIEAASDIVLSTALTTTSTFPVSPAGSIAIDGSSAAQYTVVGVGPG